MVKSHWVAFPLVTDVREGRLELPRPLGHRILRLLGPCTRLRCTCRPVSFGVVLCPRVSSCREQDVSRTGAGGLSVLSAISHAVSYSRLRAGALSARIQLDPTFKPCDPRIT